MSVCPYLFEEGWNQTREDWERLERVEPGGVFRVHCDGVLAATATLLTFGTTLGWIGMVITRPEFRRRGFAKRLMHEALGEARRRGVATLKLDATDAGRPLYLDCGFVDEQPIERWRREPRPVVGAEALQWGSAPKEVDFEAFGADRLHFMEELGPFAVRGTAYGTTRPGLRAWYLGPCVARCPDDAAALITSLVATHADEPWFWDILPANTEAVRIATGLGFAPVRRLTRMRLGPPIATHDNLVYAIAGFEAG